MNNVRAYLAALWKHGSFLLTSGTFGVIVTVYGLKTGKNLPQSIGLLILGAAMMIAPYFAWKYEHEQVIPKPPPPDPSIVAELGRLNMYQIFAVRQLARTGGMTGGQFEQRYRELGFPVATLADQKEITNIFEVLNRETTLLTQNGSGVWSLRDRDAVTVALLHLTA